MDTTQTHEEWLASLKAGDQVAIRAGMSRSYSLYSVAQRTKQHIILNTGTKYRVSDGRSLTSDKSIEEVTPAVLAAIKRSNLENAVWSEIVKISNINVVCKMSDEALEEILAVLKKHGGA